MKFNLVEEPWIKVFASGGETKEVSMIDLFENTHSYRALAGEMPAKDAIIMRFLLAVLTTVYSRVNAEGNSYEWIELYDKYQVKKFTNDNSISSDLAKTWKNLYSKGKFSNALKDYLLKNKDKFDFSSLYEVDTENYNHLTKFPINPEKRTGTVEIKQIDRTISESNNSLSVFSPKSDLNKNAVSDAELVRWLIMYQNIAGVTDKNKVTTKPISAGWYYKIRPVYAKGNNLFDTLMLNLVLNTYEDGYRVEKPIWEFDSMKECVEFLLSEPDITKQSTSFVYTLPSRMFHIKGRKIYTAGLPRFDNTNAFNDHMAVFTKNKDGELYSQALTLRDLNNNSWSNIGEILNSGVVKWLKKMKVPAVTLRIANLISDGKPSSQMPEAAFDKSLTTSLDNKKDILQAIDLSNKISLNYWYFVRDIAVIRGNSHARKFADSQTKNFNYLLVKELKMWIDEGEFDLEQLKDRIKPIFEEEGEFLVQNSGSRDIRGIKDKEGNLINIFTLHQKYKNIGFSYLK